MTDTRLPEQWLFNPTMDKLSDGAWRVWTRALIWCNSQGTDGDIPSLYIKYTYPWGDPSEYVLELLDVGLLEQTENGFVILDWVRMGQSPASQVAAYKEKNRLRQQQSRERKRTQQTESVTDDVTRDVGQDTQDTLGQANYGKATWPKVQQPGAQVASTSTPSDIPRTSPVSAVQPQFGKCPVHDHPMVHGECGLCLQAQQVA